MTYAKRKLVLYLKVSGIGLSRRGEIFGKVSRRPYPLTEFNKKASHQTCEIWLSFMVFVVDLNSKVVKNQDEGKMTRFFIVPHVLKPEQIIDSIKFLSHRSRGPISLIDRINCSLFMLWQVIFMYKYDQKITKLYILFIYKILI